LNNLEEVVLSVEELEALRLAHVEGHYQKEASEHMKISRATFGRILESAHRKVARALVQGCALRIEGGAFCLGEGQDCVHCRRPCNMKREKNRHTDPLPPKA
jgi:predicted DNA-binding protein (UPF0251 family)